MNSIRNRFMLALALIFLVAAEWHTEKKQVARAITDAQGVQQVLIVAGNYF